MWKRKIDNTSAMIMMMWYKRNDTIEMRTISFDAIVEWFETYTTSFLPFFVLPIFVPRLYLNLRSKSFEKHKQFIFCVRKCAIARKYDVRLVRHVESGHLTWNYTHSTWSCHHDYPNFVSFHVRSTCVCAMRSKRLYWHYFDTSNHRQKEVKNTLHLAKT